MSLTPHQSGVGSCEVQSPDIFMSDIRRNLDGQFLNARDSLQQENMCVYARVRPMLPHELAKGFKECIAAVDEKTIRTVIPVSSSRYKSSRESEEIEDFSFSAAFGPETGQFLFFLETMLPTLQNFVESDNSLIFSYGITGSGKTYTLQGDSENPGIIPLSLRLYFAAVEKQLLDGIKVKPHMYNNIIALSAAEQKEEHRVKKQLLSLYDDECEIAPGSFRSSNNKTFAMTLCDLFSDDFKAEERETTLAPEEMASAQAATVMREVIRNSAESQLGICNVWVSFVEIYNESIFDLLTPVTKERKRLNLRECNGNVYIEGAREICVSNGDEALKILNIGRKNLSIASTKMNYQSSRSHCIYTIRVVRVRDANNMSYGKVNRLSFCDLAGSERTAKTQTTGIRLKEAGSINTSLLVLGRCLEQLRMNQMGRDKRMIPFRDSKLTRLFSGFFLGQGKAVMIANASPSDFTYDETSHVLKFSALARKLKVNDTFYTDATSTLQSICNEWSNASNRSICNDSTDSLDSDSEIIQKKDEIIEKLLILAEKLTKKEQENADMEIKIRREVCNDYSEYSDRLLEEKRIMYEEQMEAMRENFKRMVANREKMYEKIIEDYKHRLNETTGSDEDAFDNSHSIMELENSAELSPEKSQNEKIIDKSEESYQSQSSKLKELESTLESTTAELEKAKKELCESQKLVASLDKELKVCKEEKEKLSNESANYKNVASESTENIRKYEADIQELEEQLSTLKKELNTIKELNQSKEFNLHEMESDNGMLKAEVEALKKDIHGLKDIIESYEANMEEYRTKMSALEDELLCSEKKYVSAKEDLQMYMNSASEIEKENEMLKSEVGSLKDKLSTSKQSYDLVQEQLLLKLNSSSEIEKENGELKSELKTLTEKINEFQEEVKTYISAAKDDKRKISNLEEKLISNENHFEEQLQEKLNLTSQLKKDIEDSNVENERMRSEIKELKESKAQDQESVANYKAKIHTLEDKLFSIKQDYVNAAEELQNRSKDVSELEKELKSKIIDLKTEVEELQNFNTECRTTEDKYKTSTKILEEKLQSTQLLLDTAEKQIEGKSAHSLELGKEIDMYKNKIRILDAKSSEAAERLKELLKENESKGQNFEQMTTSLQEKLKVAEEELKKIFLHSIELLSELEVDDSQENSVTKVQKSYEQLSDSHKSYQSVTQKLKEKISSLHQDLLVANKNADLIKKEMKVRETVSAELEKEIDMYKHDIEALKEKMLEKDELEKKFMLLNQELETVKGVNKQISSKLNDLEMSRNLEEENKGARGLISEKLEEELSLVQKKLNTAANDIQEKNLKIAELEIEKSAHDSEILKLKKNQEMIESQTTEKLCFTDRELKTAKDEAQQLSSKLCELQNEKNAFESEIQQLKQNQMVVSELTEKLHSVEKELKTAKDEVEKLSLKIYELETSNCAYELDNKELKEVQQVLKQQLAEKFDSVNKEVRQLSSELLDRNNTCELGVQTLEQNEQVFELELKEKLQLVDKELETANEKVQKLSSKICELEKVNSAYELDNKELKEVQQVLRQQLAENLDSANKEVQHLSSELLNRNGTCEFGTQTLEQNEQIVDLELTIKLQLVDKELKTANEEVQKLSSKICELVKEKSVYESEIQKLKQNHQMVESELTEKLHLVDIDLKTANEDIQTLSSRISELEKENTAYESKINKLKQEQQISLSEKLCLITKELETANKDNHEKSSKLHELQKSINTLKSEIEKVQGEKQNLISEKIALQDKLVVIEAEIEILKQDIQQKCTNEQKTESEICAYKEEINKLKEDYANLHSEKVKSEREVNCYEEKVEKLQKNSPHGQNADINTVNQNKLKELEKEITVYKHDIKKLKDDQELSEKEKEDLIMIISTNNEKMDDLEDKLTAFNEDILTNATTIEDLQNHLAQLSTLIELVGKCEIRASDKIKKLQDTIETHKSRELYLLNQIKNKENSIEELEKAVFDLQKQSKDVQRSCDQKLVSELEQHETEIVQTIKLKHLVEEENMSLKKQKLKSLNSKLKPPDVKKTGNTAVVLPKKSVDIKGKENVPKISRTLRKKEINLKEASFSSIDCSTPIVDKVKSRKRASDEDFEPSNVRASKKVKSNEATKIPTKRPSRKKLQSDKIETLSPIQKLTNSITSKVKVLSSNIPHISSPRLTRGRKRLFNLEAPSTSGTQRATKGMK